jgi:hypothetical protein
VASGVDVRVVGVEAASFSGYRGGLGGGRQLGLTVGGDMMGGRQAELVGTVP